MLILLYCEQRKKMETVAAVTAATVDMSVYDLTSVISQYLDRHLALPLIEFLECSDAAPRTPVCL